MDWLDELEERGRLTGKVTDMILKQHGARGKRAIDAVSEGRVKEYKDFVVVVGKGDEYIVEGRSCTRTTSTTSTRTNSAGTLSLCSSQKRPERSMSTTCGTPK